MCSNHLDHHFSLCLGAWRFSSLALTFAGYGWLCSCDLHCHAEATSGVCLICFFFFCDDPLGGKYSRYYGEWRCLGWSCIFLFWCVFSIMYVRDFLAHTSQHMSGKVDIIWHLLSMVLGVWSFQYASPLAFSVQPSVELGDFLDGICRPCWSSLYTVKMESRIINLRDKSGYGT